MHGLMSYEVATLVRLGVSATDALLAATRGGAAACRILDRTGTLESGKDADIIAVRGDPLADIAALRNIAFVMRAGRTIVPTPSHAAITSAAQDRRDPVVVA
jgi:imidazolonepropionase-like amidohydrolase